VNGILLRMLAVYRDLVGMSWIAITP